MVEQLDKTCRDWLGYALKIGFNTAGKRTPDVESDAMLGLLKAVHDYDPARNASFRTYLAIRVRGSVLDGLRDRDHLTRSDRKAARTDVDIEGVQLHPISLDVLREEVGFEKAEASAIGDALDDMVEEAQRHERCQRLLRLAQMLLPPREQKVLTEHYLQGRRLKDIGVDLGVTESRVSQILKRAEDDLREVMFGKPSVEAGC